MPDRPDDEDGAGHDDVPAPPPSADDPAYTDSGAPTNAAHRAVGDGTLIGAIPAGLSPAELDEVANLDQPGEGGTS